MFHVVWLCLCWCHLTGMSGTERKKVQSILVTERDSVTFHIDVTEVHKDDDILWKFGYEKSFIAKINRETAIYSIFDDVLDGRFRDRLKVDHQTGSLTIMNTTTEHAGVYELEITGAKRSIKKFNVSVFACLPIPVLIRDCSSSSSSSVQYYSVVCSVVNVSAVSLSWYKGNSVLSSISVSDLSISLSLPLEVEYQDNNTYSCVINNTISNQTTHLDINTLWPTCRDKGLPHMVLLSGAAAGSLLIVALFGTFCICKKCRKSKQETCDEEITYAEPTFKKRKAHKSKRKEEDVVYAPVAVRS